jgi:hypothetical protein
VSYETRAHPGPPPEGGATCVDCQYWERLEAAGRIAPPSDPQFQARCQALGLDPEENAHLAQYGRCRGRPPGRPGPVQWPLTPALEPCCGWYKFRARS